MEKRYLDKFIVAGIVLIILVGLLIYKESKVKVLAGFGSSYRQPSVSYTTTVGMNNTTGVPAISSSTQVLAANDNRVYARCNNRNTNGFEVSFMRGSMATTSVPAGLILAPMSSTTPNNPSFFEINMNDQYTGAIYAYAQATSSVVCVEN